MPHFTHETRKPVAIVGAGPVGLSLALGLARHNVSSIILEKKKALSPHSKAPGIQARTLEIFRQWGVDQAFSDQATRLSRLTLHSTEDDSPLLDLNLSLLEEQTSSASLSIIEQSKTERILLEAVRGTGCCDVCFDTEMTGFEDTDGYVRVNANSPDTSHVISTQYLVGCDGASSTVRKLLGLPFEGITYPARAMLADVRIDDQRNSLPWPRARITDDGVLGALQLERGLWRLIAVSSWHDPGGSDMEEAGRDDVEAKMNTLIGPGDFDLVWASLFNIHRRISPKFRVGRILLAGDAAHVNSPAGGQGMNSGIHDAHNLAWKLAHALRGGAVEKLLDSYEAERRKVVVGQVNRFTDFLTRGFIVAPYFFRKAVFGMIRASLQSRAIHRRFAEQMAMLSIRQGHSALLQKSDKNSGKRLPNIKLITPSGKTVRLHDLLGTTPTLLFHNWESRFPMVDVPVNFLVIGKNGYGDEGGRLGKALGVRRGMTLVRPDLVVAWSKPAMEDSGEIDDAIRASLGWLN